MQDNTETSLFNDCDKDNLNGSKLHEHDSGIENSNSSYNNSTTNLMGKSTESPSTPNRTMSNAEKYEAKKSIFILIGIFSISLAAMFYVYMMFPKLDESERQHIKLPWDIEDAKKLGQVLDRYKDKYYVEVMSAVVIIYIFLQAFAIPGSLFLSILSGFLFKFHIALGLVCICSAVGASLCYLLSQLVGRRLVKHYFPERAQQWSEQVDKHRNELLSYILFLRMTPFLPNWFINLVAPVIGVPLYPFALGTFLGVAPPSFLAIQAGQTLNTMASSSDAFSLRSTLLLGVFAVLSLTPVIFKKQFKQKLQ
ncbi:transmembrane protein 41B [Sitodiplosis mosellana]|uniref:transmembrane protein 41B n=1 Tax=Sitodiplosis mosellana TaxID=263140 RepID=UPI0024444B8C|nr:transmembrane protein 41B [Sitodiplosis mosellana]